MGSWDPRRKSPGGHPSVYGMVSKILSMGTKFGHKLTINKFEQLHNFKFKFNLFTEAVKHICDCYSYIAQLQCANLNWKT